jgi:methionyl-tRNA formyltransferase
LKVAFFGYSQVGARAVELLVERGDTVSAVVTHRDDPDEERWYRTPAEAAAAHGLPIVYGEDLADRGLELTTRSAPDLVLSVFYRSMLPQAVLDAASIALNLHPSLLPAYRGRAPLNWVLVRGETMTGITLHHMVRRADAGDIVGQRAISIAPRETALSLYYKMEDEGISLLREMLPLLEAGTAPRQPQDESKANVVGRRRPEDGRIDWSWPAEQVDCLVRAVAPPWPGAFGMIEGKTVRVLAGRPDAPFESDADRPLAGTLRYDGSGFLIATGNRWFRLEQTEGLEAGSAHSSPADSAGSSGIANPERRS